MGRTILDVYNEKHGQFIVLVSGLSSTGKTKLGKNIERDFRLKFLNMKNFVKKDYNKMSELPNGKFVLNIDSDDIYDWDKLNDEVNTNKKGVIIVGNVFPTNLLKFKPDYHIHLRMPKQILKTKREAFIKAHPEKNYNLEDEILRINALTYPYYMDVLNRMMINKFINILELTPEKVYDIAFEEIIKFIWGNIPSPRKMTDSYSKSTTSDKKIDDSDDFHKDPYFSGEPMYDMAIDTDEDRVNNF